MGKFYIKSYLATFAIFFGLGYIFIATLQLYESSVKIACVKTGEMPSDEFLFKQLYHVVYPAVQPAYVSITLQDNLFYDKVILSDGQTEITVARDIEKGGFLSTHTALGLGLGYYELNFDEPKLRGRSVTFDPCGEAQDGMAQLGAIRSIAGELQKARFAENLGN